MKGESNCCLKKGKNKTRGCCCAEKLAGQGAAGGCGAEREQLVPEAGTRPQGGRCPTPAGSLGRGSEGTCDPGSSGGRSCESRDPTAHARRVQDGGAALPARHCPSASTARAQPQLWEPFLCPCCAQRDPGCCSRPSCCHPRGPAGSHCEKHLPSRTLQAGEALKCDL